MVSFSLYIILIVRSLMEDSMSSTWCPSNLSLAGKLSWALRKSNTFHSNFESAGTFLIVSDLECFSIDSLTTSRVSLAAYIHIISPVYNFSRNVKRTFEPFETEKSQLRSTALYTSFASTRFANS